MGVSAEVASLAGWFDHRKPSFGAGESYRQALELLDAEGSNDAIVHVGHSTHLLSIASARFLTDPWFFDPAFGALEHEASAAVAPEHVGRLDAVLVSHDHPDHADLRAIDRLDKRATVVVATRELAAKARALHFSAVTVLPPWKSLTIGATTVTAVPALHDVYEIGFVLSSARRRVYFAGDTRLHPDIPAIAERFTPDVAILPVDGTRFRGGPPQTMTPEDAARAVRTLGAKLVVPSHAEAIYSDALAEHVLTSAVARARARFADVMASSLPRVRCVVPGPGDRILL